MKYDNRHGGPFDRGCADYWYHRPPSPHYYLNGTGTSTRIERVGMTRAEVEAYLSGYAEAEAQGDRKDWS